MAWFRVDDQFGSHPKVMMIPRSERRVCLGAWLLAGVWSAQHLTDGMVPDYMLEEIGIEMSQRDRLVTVGLWVEEGEGIRFKDWADHQPTRADVLATREKERRRKEAYRQRKAGNTGQSPGGTTSDDDAGHQQGSGHPVPARPGPSRPVPSPSGSKDPSGGGEAASPPAHRRCKRHGHWDHDDACRACAADRKEYEAEKAQLDADARRHARRERQFCEHGLPRHEACERCGDAWPGR